MSLITTPNASPRRLRPLLREAGGCIAAAVLLFFLGVVLAPFYPGPGLRMAESIMEMAQALQGKNMLEVSLAIFARNVFAVSIALVLGVGLGLMPAAAALLNGWLAGVVAAEHPGALWLILPHGIFELPAVFIGWGLGIWCGLWVVAPAPFATLRARLKNSFWVLAVLIVPLLAVAALVEGALVVWLTR